MSLLSVDQNKPWNRIPSGFVTRYMNGSELRILHALSGKLRLLFSSLCKWLRYFSIWQWLTISMVNWRKIFSRELILNWHQVFEISMTRVIQRKILALQHDENKRTGSHPALISSPEEKKTGKALRFVTRQRYLAYDNRTKFNSSRSIICDEKSNRFQYFFPLK